MEGNKSISKAEIVIEKKGYAVNFDCEASICKILGFEQHNKFEGIRRHTAGKIVDIISVTHLVVNTNVVESNYINEQLAARWIARLDIVYKEKLAIYAIRN